MRKLDLTSDNGKFRAALLLAGFFKEAECIVFNDKNLNSRRLKLWRAQTIATAPKTQVALLLGWLSAFFGERFINHGFGIRAASWGLPEWAPDEHSFHIHIAL